MSAEAGPVAPVAPPHAGSWADRTAAEVLAARYGMAARTIERLGGEVDTNLAVQCDDGRRVVVKIGPDGADLDHLAWQHRLIDALQDAPDLPPVPQILRALDGTDVSVVEDRGRARPVRVQTWLPGRAMAELNRHSPQLLRDWGRAAAQLVRALPKDAPPERRAASHHWAALQAPVAVESQLWAVQEADRRADVARILARFDRLVTPVLDTLPQQVVHQDLNDFNVLARPGSDRRHRLSGVLDFTDALFTARVSELAIAVAYAMLRKPDPLLAAAEVVRGFVEVLPLSDAELRALHPIAAARLCVNATTWTARAATGDNGEYARARMRHTWPTIARLAALPADLAEQTVRLAAGVDGPVRPPLPAPTAAVPARVVGAHLTPVGAPVPRRTEAGVPATLRLGVELAGLVGTPLAGVVEHSDDDVLILRHDAAEPVVWTRWVLTRPDGARPAPGERLDAATPVEALRVAAFTGLEAAQLAPLDVVGWAAAPAWARISPDPAALFAAPGTVPAPDVQGARARHFARSQRHYYQDPPRLVGSEDVWLHDEHGLAYLDAINNVAHVGHANPAVVAAAHRQAARLNTNSRFVYDGIGEYAQRLVDRLPDPLDVVFLVCTGSEANDLALRIARQVTGRTDVVVIDGAYHGNTAAVTDVSPNRYKGAGGCGAPPTTHELERPDRYRGRFGYDDPDAGVHYAADAAAVVAGLPRPPAALIAESLMGTAGTIVFPPGYLAPVYEAVRSAGGLCIADEVQVGFGRLGSHFWGFQTQGVVPDIVTLGKPIGNGYPMAAVVTTRAIADAFDTGMKYFNTFGGNPVSCAVGLAVLDELDARGLQAHAAEVGARLREGLVALARRHPLIGDVRGEGLYLGVELVRDRTTKQPAGAEAFHVSERMKDEGVIVYPTGPYDTVLKIKPPMTFTHEHADRLLATLELVLSGDW